MKKTGKKQNRKNNWNQFAWHHVRAKVPSDWEITAYSVEDRVGRIEFNTRHGLQATVSWEPCKREPDRLTTMTAFIVNNILGKSNARNLRSTDISTETFSNFLLGWLDDETPCQAMAYNPESNHLIRWIFEGYSDRTGRTDTIYPILESFDFNDDEDLCEYNLHGIHCKLPWDYKIEDIIVLPANVMMNFESELTKRKTVFRRWGMASMIFDGRELTDFYRPILRSHSIIIDNAKPCRVNGHDARRILFNAPREHHSERFMRRRWHNGIALIWHNTDTNRIYTAEQIGPDNTPELDFSVTLPGISIQN
ncbi:MAG: hypothetical protein GX804_01425 [Lentisphaerae bacterium]|jgi:hypothetical protein|nr:hypothetical protein [Lentisphaerota bacterium]